MNSIITVVGALIVSASGLTGVFYEDIDNLVQPQAIKDPTNGTLPALPPPPGPPEAPSVPEPTTPRPPQPPEPQPPEECEYRDCSEEPQPCDDRECREPCGHGDHRECEEPQPCDSRDCHEHEPQPCDARDCHEPEPHPCDARDCHEQPAPCDKQGTSASACHKHIHMERDRPVDPCGGVRDVRIHEKDTIVGAYHETWTFDVDCPVVTHLEVSFVYTGVKDIGSFVTWNPELVLRDGAGDVMASSDTNGVRTGETDQGLYFYIEGDLGTADLGEWSLDFSACTHIGDYELEISVSY